MSNVPTNLIPSTITQLPEYTGDSTLGYLPYSLGGRTYKVQFSNIAAVGAVPSTRVIATGNGLQGGGDLSQNRTISIIPHGVGYSQLDFTGVVASTYGSADTSAVVTVDATGRITNIVNTPIVLADYVPSSRTVTAGAGLTGGGQLNGNITIALDPSNATPQSLGAASAGTGTQAARDDHVHPAVDLTDTSETQGVLPLGRGGTGVALSPVVGAVIYADNDSLNQTVAGNAGQILTSAGGLGAPYWQTVTGTGTVTSVDLTAGTGISVSGGPITTTGSITVTNTAPDQVVSLTGAGTTSITGTYPNFTITSNDQYVGTVTSVALSGGTTGLTVSGSPITTAGTITLGGTLAVANGGTGGGTAATARSNLGAAASGANTDITSIALTTGTISTPPTSSTDIANKLYVDTLAVGSIHYHTPVQYEVPDTTGNLNATYNQPGGAGVGVGATLTNAGTQTAFTPDGVVAIVGDRILVYNQTNAFENGIYTVTTVGSGSTNWVLTRATDADTYSPSSNSGLGQGDAFFVTSGNTGAGETYVCNTNGVITFGTTAITFAQISSAQVYSAGTGLTLTGTVFSITPTGVTAATYGSGSSVPTIVVNAQGQITSASNTSISIAASQVTSGVFSITQGGTGQSTASAAFNALSPITATGDLIVGNGTNSATRLGIGAAGYVLTSDGTTAAWAASTGGVTSFSAGTTGFTPSTTTTGAVTLAGTLNVANGGTGATSLTSGYLVKGNGTSAVSASVIYDTGTNVGIGTPSPSSLLNLYSSTASTLTVDGDTLSQINLRRSSTNAALPQFTFTKSRGTIASRTAVASGDGLGTMRFQAFGGTTDRIIATVTGAVDTYVSDSDISSYLTFATSSAGSVAANERLRIGPAGQIGLSGANYGSSGQLLTSNGASAAPTWQDAPATGVTQARATAISMILGF